MMKLTKLCLAAVLLGIFAISGCGDSASDVCDVGLCAQNNTARNLCINDVNECQVFDGDERDDCIAAALLDNCEVVL